jgi:phosphate-selective porin OprO/OprP
MNRMGVWRRALGALVCCGGILLLANGPVRAADDKVLAELLQRLEKLEKQNQELQDRLAGMSAPGAGKAQEQEKKALHKAIEEYQKDKEKKKKQEDDAKKAKEEAEGYKIGTDLGLTARWRQEQGLWFETKNQDFVSHIGFYMQWDNVWFGQNGFLREPGQLGDLQDGTYFRRIRPLWDGRAWDFVEWNVILALEQVNGSPINGGANINVDEMWAGVYGVPIIGRIRGGHLKINQGLEGNQWSSSRSQTFLENASYTDAFYNIFGTGVQFCNSFLDDGRNGDRLTYQCSFYRDDNPRSNTGEDFGDGQYAVTGRVTGLLIDECQDRHFLHLGLSGTWRKAQAPGTDVSGAYVERFSARPEQRDGIGGFGDASTLPGDTSRMVDTGTILARSATVVGTELWYNLGSFNVMAEWGFAQMTDAQVVIPAGGGVPAHTVFGNRNFNGGYVTASYFLTGESMLYDHTYGRRGTFYIARPFTNAFLVRDENGGLAWGPGAWEVAARYSYLNLNDGPVRGGVMGGLTLGLNWYLNSNFKIQFQYLYNNRWDKVAVPGSSVTGAFGQVPGDVQGFATRMQIQF